MTAAVAGPVTVRVTVADAWKTVALSAGVGESAGAVKTKALAAVHIDAAQWAGYEVKIGGALVRDESQPLSRLGVTDGTPLVVLSRRRRPVR
jgi:hypothetical protein